MVIKYAAAEYYVVTYIVKDFYYFRDAQPITGYEGWTLPRPATETSLPEGNEGPRID